MAATGMDFFGSLTQFHEFGFAEDGFATEVTQLLVLITLFGGEGGAIEHVFLREAGAQDEDRRSSAEAAILASSEEGGELRNRVPWGRRGQLARQLFATVARIGSAVSSRGGF